MQSQAAPNAMPATPLGSASNTTGTGKSAEGQTTQGPAADKAVMHSGNAATPTETMTSGMERAMAALANSKHPMRG